MILQPLELDHVFVFCEKELQEANALADLGFSLNDGRVHEGQGTANRCVVFEENYLEFIYLASESEIKANPLKLWDRALWRQTSASPFGICLRGKLPEHAKSHFWQYQPDYSIRGQLWIANQNQNDLSIPFIFVFEPVLETTSLAPESLGKTFPTTPSPHALGTTKIVKVEVQGRFTQLDEVVLNLLPENITVKSNHRHSMSLSVDGVTAKVVKISDQLEFVIVANHN